MQENRIDLPPPQPPPAQTCKNYTPLYFKTYSNIDTVRYFLILHLCYLYWGVCGKQYAFARAELKALRPVLSR